MTWLYEFLQRRWQALVLLLLAASFAAIAADVLRTGHVEGTQFLGVVAPAVGSACVLIGLLAGRTVRGAMAVVLLFVVLAGLLGAWRHLEGGRQGAGGGVPVLLAAEKTQLVRYAPAPAAQPGGGRVPAVARGSPSPFMPLVVSGLALMAAILLLAPGDRQG